MQQRLLCMVQKNTDINHSLSYSLRMNTDILQDIFSRFSQGMLDEKSALAEARRYLACRAAEDSLHGLCLDPGRNLRTSLGEVVFAQGKSQKSLLNAVSGLSIHGPVLVSRVKPAQAKALQDAFPKGLYWPDARLFSLNGSNDFAQNHLPPWPQTGEIMVVSAGAADLPVALEAFGSLCFWGISCGFISDAGIAGLHRLTPHLPALHAAHAIIAVAGMEGALPGVLAGLTPAPVLAVPTSVGYGVGAGGFAALAGMLCSCVPGISVVNIDNGFGAAAFAAKMIKQVREKN